MKGQHVHLEGFDLSHTQCPPTLGIAGEGPHGDAGPERRQEAGVCALLRRASERERVRVHVVTLVKEAPQWAVFSWGLSLCACAQGSQITSLSMPTAQAAPHPGEVLRYCLNPAFPSSIRTLLHSCESFCKQTQGREKREQEGEEGRLDTNLALPPPFPLLSLSIPTRRVLD